MPTMSPMRFTRLIESYLPEDTNGLDSIFVVNRRKSLIAKEKRSRMPDIAELREREKGRFFERFEILAAICALAMVA
jgi:hypothetical protein